MAEITKHGMGLIAVLALLCLTVAPAMAAPDISFLSVPSADSQQTWVSGMVEDVTPSDYVVVLYIKVYGNWWGPKPYWDYPLTPIRPDLFWNTTYVTSPTDYEATRFAAFLIPKTALGPGMPPALAGTSTLPVSLSAFPSDEQGCAVPVPLPGPSITRNGTELVGLCFGPYVNGEAPDVTVIPESTLRERLMIVRDYTTWVRSYGTGGGLDAFGDVAHDLGMKTAVGAWLEDDPQANLQELETLIEIGKQGDADVLIVGSETLLRNDLTDRDLITYIQWVRREVPGVPVGTADVHGEFINYPWLVDASDILFVHIFPFWEQKGIDQAVDNTIENYTSVVAIAGGRPVVIAELGWPDGGSPNGGGVPGEANAIRYLHETTARLHQNDIPYYYFEAFDEAWKINEGDVGPHWGLWYGNLTLKPGRFPLTGLVSGKPGIFRNGFWILDKNGNFVWDGPPDDIVAGFGMAGDTPVVVDWNNDDRENIGVFRNGFWILDYNGNFQWNDIGTGKDLVAGFGAAGDVPVAKDWNGDGSTEIGVFRASAGQWIIDNNRNFAWDGTGVGKDLVANLGQSGDVAVAGEWNEANHDMIGIFRNGFWILDGNGNFIWDGTPNDIVTGFGTSGDIPVVADWDDDGQDNIGVFRNGFWILDYNGNFQWDGPPVDIVAPFGAPGDVPVPKEWNGDGSLEIAVYRASAGQWIIDWNGNFAWDGTSAGKDIVTNLGQSGDKAAAGSW